MQAIWHACTQDLIKTRNSLEMPAQISKIQGPNGASKCLQTSLVPIVRLSQRMPVVENKRPIMHGMQEQWHGQQSGALIRGRHPITTAVTAVLQHQFKRVSAWAYAVPSDQRMCAGGLNSLDRLRCHWQKACQEQGQDQMSSLLVMHSARCPYTGLTETRHTITRLTRHWALRQTTHSGIG